MIGGGRSRRIHDWLWLLYDWTSKMLAHATLLWELLGHSALRWCLTPSSGVPLLCLVHWEAMTLHLVILRSRGSCVCHHCGLRHGHILGHLLHVAWVVWHRLMLSCGVLLTIKITLRHERRGLRRWLHRLLIRRCYRRAIRRRWIGTLHMSLWVMRAMRLRLLIGISCCFHGGDGVLTCWREWCSRSRKETRLYLASLDRLGFAGSRPSR